MKKILLLISVMATLLLSGCVGEQARVGPGEVGKLVETDGMSDEIIKPSSFRMEFCSVSACPYLVRLQTTKSMETAKVDQVFLTKSQVDLDNVQIGIQFLVRPDKDSINKVFSEIRPGQRAADKDSKEVAEETADSKIITSESVWRTYLERKVPGIVVDVLRNYTVDDVLTKIPELRLECEQRLQKAIEGEPVMVPEGGLTFPNGIGDLPPKVIQSYRDLYAVEADKQKSIRELEARLEVERQRLAVQDVRARNDAKIAKLLGVTVTRYMELKIAEKYADAVTDASDNEQPFALGTLPLLRTAGGAAK